MPVRLERRVFVRGQRLRGFITNVKLIDDNKQLSQRFNRGKSFI